MNKAVVFFFFDSNASKFLDVPLEHLFLFAQLAEIHETALGNIHIVSEISEETKTVEILSTKHQLNTIINSVAYRILPPVPPI